ncbi:hypothetical protein LZP69_03880 [Shewanella sp. AS1]|uniref:hypothetical protein n=1 Tax=Shewanella sp. AS1 TaxID=2907626 RepID=UPI001F1FD3A4|nr:hypothetical protein [Shewanella sp. AS1]MCE9678336.1 hypothetical protein [Shewanella sp. AS1]
MSNLTKEEVISALETALSKAQGKTVSIEQKGSWYKIDGGKSLRFSDLEAMLAEQGTEAPKAKTETVKTAKLKTEKAKAAKPKAAAKPAKASPKTDAKGSDAKANKGMTPKELWRAKLAGKGQLPRGF